MVGKAQELMLPIDRPDSLSAGVAVSHFVPMVDPQFIALEFKLPFVNLWHILVDDMNKVPKPSGQRTEENTHLVFHRLKLQL